MILPGASTIGCHQAVTDDSSMRTRKADHIRLCLSEESQFDQVNTGLEAYRFHHCALPEMAPEDVKLDTEFLGKKLSAPLIVSSMTGGPVDGARINENIARGVEQLGLGMGIGSQRIALVEPDTADSFKVRPHAPNSPILANLGAVQLNYGFTAKHAKDAVEMLKADGLFLHLNALQEVIQPEGDTNFSDLLSKIEELMNAVDFPVLIKECGCGISGELAQQLYGIGVKGIDVSGAGGTSWSKVEAHRAEETSQRNLGLAFANWGIPTAASVLEIRTENPNGLLIASGGIRNGIDAAKAIALGADIVSIAQPVLQAALHDVESVVSVLTQYIQEIRTVCFLTGSRTIADLKNKGKLRRIN